MNKVLQKRQSIHPDETSGFNKQTDEKLSRCKSCSKMFLVSEDETEMKFDESDAEDWVNSAKKKRDVDIDLENLPDYICKGCKTVPVTSPAESSFKWIIMLIVLIGLFLIVCVAVLIMYYEDNVFHIMRNKNIPVNMKVKTNADQMLENELLELEKTYSNQIEDTWITLISGIKSVIREEPNMPSTFLLLFDSEPAGKAAQCIAQDVSKPAIKYLLEKSDTPLVVSGAKLNEQRFLDEPGVLLKSLNNTVRVKGALVVTNLHEVPPEVVRMFHFVCDRYTPLVEKAVTFFTLKVYKMPSQKDQQKTVEETMIKLWSSALDDNLLRPLITRMTSNIIRINTDSNCHVSFDSL